MQIVIKDEFKLDYISRASGEILRKLIAKSIKNKEFIILDFAGLIVASSAFFDEGIAKLCLEEGITADDFSSYVSIKNLNKNDLKLLQLIAKNRTFNFSMP